MWKSKLHENENIISKNIFETKFFTYSRPVSAMALVDVPLWSVLAT